jgi:hypothetical protein
MLFNTSHLPYYQKHPLSSDPDCLTDRMVIKVQPVPPPQSRAGADEAAAVQNQLDFLLLRLPAELRNMTFGYALRDLEIFIGRRYTGLRHNRKNCYVKHGAGHLGDHREQSYIKNRLASTQACHHLHEETRALSFKNVYLGIPLAFVQFVGARILAQEQLDCIKHVQLRLGNTDVHIVFDGDTANSAVVSTRYLKDFMPALAKMQGLKKVIIA